MNSSENEKFAELFRREHTEQFYVLVKMHLSFLLHMTTEESECFYEKVKPGKWSLVPFGKKGRQKSEINNVLSQEVFDHVHQLIEHLNSNKYLITEGIFRRTGSVERQNELRATILKGENINFEQFTVHDCASVLKGFLADLSEPLTTDIQFPLYCQIAEDFKAENQSKTLESIQLLLLLLPKENKSLLKSILGLLHVVTTHEDVNKMSAENLAKMFTPHLFCPRKLPPEVLLKDSQTLFGTVAFMIKSYSDLFNIPAKLMLDFRSHYEQGNVLNESVKGAAHTVFTFVDNKLTAQENTENVTEGALAELYAHIQSLPESSKKRRLVKKFNKQNGHGTPLQSAAKNKSFGDSIKKHMFHRKLLKRSSGFMKNASSEEMLNSPLISRKLPARLFCHNFESSEDENNSTPLKRQRNETASETPKHDSSSSSSMNPSTYTFFKTNFKDESSLSHEYLTSTPACILNRVENVFTPECQSRKSMSPITRSARRMSRSMQETMMTPRSRKPVLLVSGTNINNLAKVTPTLTHLQEENSSSSTTEDVSSEESTKPKIEESSESPPKLETPESLSATFRQYLNSREIVVFESPTDSTFSPRPDDFQEEELEPDSKLSNSMLYVLDGNEPKETDYDGEKKLVLKPSKFDENGKPIVYETSF